MSEEHREPTLQEWLAWSMDAEPSLLPFLPDLFADLEELGARSSEVLQVVAAADLPPEPRMLDLGCGKGAVGLALLREYGGTLHGVDGMAAFVEHAERRAEAMGLTEQSIFAEGDLRTAVRQSRDYDLVCLLALGAVIGSADETVGALRECVKPGGYMLIDDAYIRDGEPIPEELVDCFDHETTNALLQAHGDRIVAELEVDGPRAETYYREMTTRIAARAESLARLHPDAADELLAYVQRQEDEVEVLCGPLVGALWLIRRVDQPAEGSSPS